MTEAKRVLVVVMAIALSAAGCALAQPMINMSFEDGFLGWTTYSYAELPAGEPGAPTVGCVGSSPCVFDLIPPPDIPDGANVCGMQAAGATVNGGVCQTFVWFGGPATISVTARAYSEKLPADGGGPWDNGCRVRIGLATSGTAERGEVTNWLVFPWGNAWYTRSLDVPGTGVYTLFIEAGQPVPNAIMSTVWDNVVCNELPHVTGSDVTVTKFVDPEHPDSTVRVQWSTNVPSTSRIDYGFTEGYGMVREDAQMVTDHDIMLTGLVHTSTYHIRASSAAPGFATWTSDDYVFYTPIQFQDIITNPGTSGSDVIVMWETDVETTSQVEYGLTDTYGLFSPENVTPNTQHVVLLTGLEEDRTYHFRVLGKNPNNYSPAASEDCTFITLPPAGSSLRNGSFEEPHAGQPHSLYPWVQYTKNGGSTGYNPIDGLVGPYPAAGPADWHLGVRAYDGSYFLGAGAHWDCRNGGVFQRVYSPPGQICTLAARCAAQNVGGNPNDTFIRLGIDPDGGVNPLGSGVQWWTFDSPTNDERWYYTAITTRAGLGGLVTVFVDVTQYWTLEWHVAAIDHVRFGPPLPMSIGQLKKSLGDRGVTLTHKIVTYVDPLPVSAYDRAYTRAYIQEDDRTAGIVVLFDQNNPEQPTVGDRVTLVGAVVLYNQEATVIAYEWGLVDNGEPLPKPLAMTGRSVGGAATPIQPALLAGIGPSNVGLRAHLFGRVTSVDVSEPYVDATAIIDDGSGIIDQQPLREAVTPGIRVKLIAKPSYGVHVGDYVQARGVISIELIDPHWPPNSGDEYYAYTLLTSQPDDWSVLGAPATAHPRPPAATSPVR